MNSTILKMLIALLPTAPFVGEYITEESPESANEQKSEQKNDVAESNETIEDIQSSLTETYPKLFNVGETNVQVEDAFDPMAGVYAVDKKDGDVTDNITVSGDVNTSTIGDYYVNYKVTNSSGGWYEMTRVVHVSENPTDEVKPVPKGSSGGGSSDDGDAESTKRVVFTGVDDVVISSGSDFKPLADVKIYDTDGFEISRDAVVGGDTVDTSKPGDYYVSYTVLDRFGKVNSVARKVTVQ